LKKKIGQLSEKVEKHLIECSAGSGWPRLSQAADNIIKVEELVQSREEMT